MEKNICNFIKLTWCIGCLEVFLPESGGLLINIVCIALISGPEKKDKKIKKLKNKTKFGSRKKFEKNNDNYL